MGMTESCSLLLLLDAHESKAKAFVVERRVMKRNVAMAKVMALLFLLILTGLDLATTLEKIGILERIYVKQEGNKSIYRRHPYTFLLSPYVAELLCVSWVVGRGEFRI